MRDQSMTVQSATTFESSGKPISTITKIGYSAGNFGKSLQWTTVDLLYLYFLTDVIGLAPTLAGLVILISLVWDGFSDPLFGYVIDRTGGKIGSYQRIIAMCAPISALGFVALFAGPSMAQGSAFVMAVGVSILFRTGYTLVDVPHNALMADLTRDSHERSAISAYRFFFSSAGAVTLSLLVIPALTIDNSDSTLVFVQFAAILAMAYLPVMWFSVFSARGAGYLRMRARSDLDVFAALRMLAKNQRLIIVLLVSALSAFLVPVLARMSVYYSKSWLADPSAASALIIAYSVGQLVSLPVWVKVSEKTEKRWSAAAAHAVMVSTCLAFLVIQPTGLWSAVAVFAAAGFAFGGINTMNWAMLPDMVEYNELETGHRIEALTFGIALLVLKVCAGLSIGMLGLALAIIGYDETAAGIGDQLPALPIFMASAPIAGSLVSILVLAKLDLSHDGHNKLGRAPAS